MRVGAEMVLFYERGGKIMIDCNDVTVVPKISNQLPLAETRFLIEAIRGCEKYSSPADFEALGAAVFRNRGALIVSLGAPRPADARVPIDPAVLAEFEQYLRELMEH